MSDIKVEIAKSIAMAMVRRNSVFSAPRLTKEFELKESPPKAPPSPASDLCKRIPPTRRRESTICM